MFAGCRTTSAEPVPWWGHPGLPGGESSRDSLRIRIQPAQRTLSRSRWARNLSLCVVLRPRARPRRAFGARWAQPPCEVRESAPVRPWEPGLPWPVGREGARGAERLAGPGASTGCPRRRPPGADPGCGSMTEVRRERRVGGLRAGTGMPAGPPKRRRNSSVADSHAATEGKRDSRTTPWRFTPSAVRDPAEELPVRD